MSEEYSNSADERDLITILLDPPKSLVLRWSQAREWDGKIEWQRHSHTIPRIRCMALLRNHTRHVPAYSYTTTWLLVLIGKEMTVSRPIQGLKLANRSS